MPKSGSSRFRAVKHSPETNAKWWDSTDTRGSSERVNTNGDRPISEEEARIKIGDARMSRLRTKSSTGKVSEGHTNEGIADPNTRAEIAKEKSKKIGDDLVAKVKKAMKKPGGALVRKSYED